MRDSVACNTSFKAKLHGIKEQTVNRLRGSI